MLSKVHLLLAATSIAAVTGTAAGQQAFSSPPVWAFGFLGPGGSAPPAAADATTPHTLPGSKVSATAAQVADTFSPPDWYPQDHPAVPDIVAHGHQATMIRACAFCHYFNGEGRPENAPLAGLPIAYFVQQMADFKADARQTSDKRNTMNMIAKGLTDEEIQAAARYFGSMPYKPLTQVKESDTAPKTRISVGLYVPLEGAAAAMEPLGQRIVDVPVKGEDTEVWKDPHTGFVAYVPAGSVAKGKALVTTGGDGRFTACIVCHGPDLRGQGPIPGIAGRSPTYIVRQLYEMQNGVRAGGWTVLMVPIVAELSADDMVNAAAYAASLAP